MIERKKKVEVDIKEKMTEEEEAEEVKVEEAEVDKAIFRVKQKLAKWLQDSKFHS
jgi:DNA-directed RNA polymerase specialized sigma24 family protein